MGDTERIDALDAEIGCFVREQLEREGPVTGWVLCLSTAHFDDDGETVYGWDYVVGPQTDVIRSFGLVNTVKIDLESVIWRAATPKDVD